MTAQKTGAELAPKKNASSLRILWSFAKYCVRTTQDAWASPWANYKIKGYKTKHLFAAAAVGMTLGNIAQDFIPVSNGSRTGVPFKLSYKGKLLGSWEGQANVGGAITNDNGVVGGIFSYSVLDCHIRDQLEYADQKGLRVEIGYRQTMSHWSWNRDTDYVVNEVIDTKTGKPVEVITDPDTPKRQRPLQERLLGCSLSPIA